MHRIKTGAIDTRGSSIFDEMRMVEMKKLQHFSPSGSESPTGFVGNDLRQ
jgi:hypothetical protein